MRNMVRLFAAASFVLCFASFAAGQTVQFDKAFVCNGEHQIVTSCRDDSNTSYCMVVYPDRPLRGGMTQQESELRGDVITRIKGCLGSSATLASVSTERENQPVNGTKPGTKPATGTGTAPTTNSSFLGFQSLDAIGTAIGSLFGWAIFALICYGIYRFLFGKKKVAQQTGPPPPNEARVKSNIAALSAFGPTVEARTARIDEVFDRRQDNIMFDYEDNAGKAKFGRSLAVMPVREVEALRTAYHLHNLGMTPWNNFFNSRFALVWADGKAVNYGNSSKYLSWDDYIRTIFTNTEQGVGLAMQDLNLALGNNPTHPVLLKLQSRLTGGGGDLAPSAPLTCSENGNYVANGLILGLDTKQRGKKWYYDGEGSLITVAPTRSGKTESHVYPNVLNWKGPMIVLDIKGEIYAKTSKWRKQNVGPVYRFSPLDDSGTHCYNPLTAVRSSAMHLWADAGVLADLMMVPPDEGGGGGGNSKFFEDAAHDLVQAAIAYVCLEKDPAKRPMSKVLDIVHGIDWDQFVSYLQSCVDMPSLARAGKALAQPIPAETRATILRTAQGKLSAWMGDLVERSTAKSDWQPLDFRSGSNPTLYICVSFSELKSISSVLRTIIGQHINLLTNGQPPARTNPPTAPILFILDEMPQLRNMPPIESALVVGAGYGVKLWMFIQNVGQLKKEYTDAEGMIGNCAVRMYMNPGLSDGTAQKLSEDIGFRDSIVDGSRVKVVEPNVLAGEQFKDKVIVWASGMARPASLQKNFAYLDEILTSRMGSL